MDIETDSDTVSEYDSEPELQNRQPESDDDEPEAQLSNSSKDEIRLNQYNTSSKLTTREINKLVQQFGRIEDVRNAVFNDENLRKVLDDADDTCRRVEMVTEHITNYIQFDLDDYCDTILNKSGLSGVSQISKDDWHRIGRKTGTVFTLERHWIILWKFKFSYFK